MVKRQSQCFNLFLKHFLSPLFSTYLPNLIDSKIENIVNYDDLVGNIIITRVINNHKYIVVKRYLL